MSVDVLGNFNPHLLTRIHSSRMRTTSSSDCRGVCIPECTGWGVFAQGHVCQEGVCPGGVCLGVFALGGVCLGVSASGVSAQGGVSAKRSVCLGVSAQGGLCHTPPPTDSNKYLVW